MLTDFEFQAILQLATTGGNAAAIQQHPNYQAFINQLMQQEKGVLLSAMFDAVRRLKQTGDQEISAKDAACTRLMHALEQKSNEAAVLRNELARNHDASHKMAAELSQYRSLWMQQQQQQHGGFYATHHQQQANHVNYADFGKQVLVNSYGHNNNNNNNNGVMMRMT